MRLKALTRTVDRADLLLNEAMLLRIGSKLSWRSDVDSCTGYRNDRRELGLALDELIRRTYESEERDGIGLASSLSVSRPVWRPHLLLRR